MSIIRKLRAFFILNILLVFLLLTGIYLYSTIIMNKIDDEIYTNYSKEISELSQVSFQGLEELVEEFANDKQLINLMYKKCSYEEKEKDIMSNIKYAKGLLTTTSFVDSIEVVDDKEKEMYSSKGTHNKFDMKTRPWFKDAYNESLQGKKVIITPLHKDFRNNRYTVSILSFIKDKDNQIIGCVILNAYMDTFTKYIEKLCGSHDKVRIYIDLCDGKYYEYSSGINTIKDIEAQKDSYIVRDKNLLFVFNNNNGVMNKVINQINKINLIMFFIFIVITIISFLIMKKKIVELIISNIYKLKNILKQLDKYDEKKFESKEGYDQLDFIINAFDDAINEKAKEYIQYDSVTKVLNRKGLEEVFNKEVKSDKSMAIIFIDLNKFKNINDVYGHSIGDEFLQEFSQTVSKALGDKGVLSRISGDEFIILYKNFSTEEELQEFYRKNIVDLFKKVKLVNNKFDVSFSAGASVYPKDSSDLSDLMKKSDYMMYTNKKKGICNELIFFDDIIYKEIEKKETISIELEQAIENKELTLKYQPIVDINKKIKKAEALMRWNNKKLGFVPPNEFITIAEENREIIKIGYWAINRVCKDIKKIKKDGVKDLIFNVNVSAIQLLEKNFAYEVKRIVEENEIKSEELCIEITESVMIEEDESSLKNLDLLKKFGFKLSLDDFGTGYTSFAYLKKFKGQSLKIDKSLLDDAKDNEYRIINSIKDIANELDFKTVVEGVETEEQFEALRNIGCALFQGYYFSRPISVEELKDFIKKNNI